jgi:hypothetical protein
MSLNDSRRVMLLCAGALQSTFLPLSAGEVLPLQVQEPAGIRRFGYPVAVRLQLPATVARTTAFRLLDGDKPLAAQFRPESDGTAGAGADRWWLDFNVDLLPYESRRYRVEYGNDVPAAREPRSGLALTEVEGVFPVANAPYLCWTIPRDLQGLLRSVVAGAAEQVKPDSPGLVLHGKDGTRYRLTGEKRAGKETAAHVVRQGRLAVALRFERRESGGPLADVESVVDLEFVASKSWVRVDWCVNDPRGTVGGLGTELHLNLDAPSPAQPTLVDFGATTMVYAKLGPKERAELRAGATVPAPSSPASASSYSWAVLRGPADALAPFVVGPKQKDAVSRPEGWAHVMDRRRCLALAVDGFARGTRDHIAVSAEGEVSLLRQLAEPGAAPPAGCKQLRFWLHFVQNPPHISAATSPQSMQTPLMVGRP